MEHSNCGGDSDLTLLLVSRFFFLAHKCVKMDNSYMDFKQWMDSSCGGVGGGETNQCLLT